MRIDTLMIGISVLVVAVLLWIAPGIQAQEVLVVACLDAPLDEFGAWQDVAGESIWVGYENGGFDLPSDLYFLPNVEFETSNGLRYLWIVASDSTPEYIYVFPFISMELYADSNGDHYGVHPCNAFKVRRDTAVLAGQVGG